MPTQTPGSAGPREWLARARAGEEAGFLELWRHLQPRLLRYLRVLNRDDADDIASETWLHVVRDLRSFSGDEDDFRRWLFTVARHRSIDAARARLRRQPAGGSVSLDAVADALPDGDMVEEQVLHALSVEQAVGLLAALSADQAEAVALRVLAGLDTAVVGTILGKSPGAVRVALHRGLRVLANDPAVQALARESAASSAPVGAAPVAPARSSAVRLLARRAAAGIPASGPEVVDL
jgi:RNA polymerase sigma-70 factor (ECF subfamily)